MMEYYMMVADAAKMVFTIAAAMLPIGFIFLLEIKNSKEYSDFFGIALATLLTVWVLCLIGAVLTPTARVVQAMYMTQ